MIGMPCRRCGTTLLAEDEWVGKKVKCPDCGARSLVERPAGPTVTAPLPSAGESEAVTLAPSASLPAVRAVAEVAGYEILSELGRGGMGVVYKARHVKLGRLVALKMILSGAHAGEDDLARFRTEAEAIARLQHPNIVQIYEIGERDGRPFFALEFCGGGSLEKALNGTPLPPKKAAGLVETLARAMRAAHEKGVVHRDLKPANVLLAEDGTPKITDFGLAKKLDEKGPTATGAVMGTPSYMAPEQAGAQKGLVGPACDIYALGAILYECLTGRPPFRAATQLDTILQVVSEEPVSPGQLQPRTPRDLETICLKCLHKEPHKRYVSAQDLARDLRRFQDGEPVRARPVSRLQRGWRWCRRNPVGAGLVAALLLGTAVATGLAVWALGERNRAELEKEEKDRQLTRAEWLVYANQLALAQAAWNEKGNEDRAKVAGGYLFQTRWDYRGWEYHYLRAQLLKKGQEVVVLNGHTLGVTAVAFSPEGKRLASASGDRTVRVWDTDTGHLVCALRHTSEVFGMAFSPDGRRLASASHRSDGMAHNNEEIVRLWNVENGQEIRVVEGPPVRILTFSPDGKRLATASADMTVRLWDAERLWDAKRLWDAEKGQELRAFKEHTREVTHLAISPDGERLASASDQTVRLWDAEKGRELLTLQGHTRDVIALAFSPGSKRLATASADWTVRVWDAEKGQELLALKDTGVTAVAFSPDGKRLAGAAPDGVRLWETDIGQEVFVIRGHTSFVTAVAFSPDGQRLASGSNDNTVQLWDAGR